LPLDLPLCLVIADPESGRESTAECDDHEDETDSQETDWSGLEMGDEDGDSTGAE
jgi:hypothetical protein